MALEDSGIELSALDPARVGVVCGTTMGESPTAEAVDTAIVCGGNGREGITPAFPFQFPSVMIPGTVAQELELCGPVMTMSTACAAGNYAIGYAADLLRLGTVDMILAGGSDPLSRVVFTGFNSMLAVAPEFCRPFDRNRKGMCVSEGSAMLVLERAESAMRRGAEIYAEVAGYGLSNDAHWDKQPIRFP
jgi:3-oxoacyl-[acyl-carrier-protein] synthase II